MIQLVSIFILNSFLLELVEVNATYFPAALYNGMHKTDHRQNEMSINPFKNQLQLKVAL